MRNSLIALIALSVGSVAAEIVTEAIEYSDGETTFVGYLAHDADLTGLAPGVLVVHEWWGLNDFARERAEQIAALGYVALAADMYGDGFSTASREEASRLAGEVRQGDLMRPRARRALEVLAEHEMVDSSRLGAIGFCFGGTAVLELSYSGADVDGIVSFHGSLTSPHPEDMDGISASILVCHGAEDPFVSEEDIDAFQRAMIESGADWQMVYYGGAVHSFTNPASGDAGIGGAAYDERAAERAWRHMGLFFEELFGD